MQNSVYEFVSSAGIKSWLSPMGDLLSGIGTFLLAVAAVWKAPSYLDKFLTQKQVQHKFELAQKAIRIFNTLRNDIQQIRNPAVYEGEEIKLAKMPSENELIKQMQERPTFGVIILRINERGGSLAEMNRFEPEFCAVFGNTDAFRIMRQQQHKVCVSAHMLLQKGLSKEQIKQHHKRIWSIHDKQDSINKNMDDAVNKIELLCRPVLGAETTCPV